MSSKDLIAERQAPARPADIVREYGPFAGASQVHGVSYGQGLVWAATGERLTAAINLVKMPRGTGISEQRPAQLDQARR